MIMYAMIKILLKEDFVYDEQKKGSALFLYGTKFACIQMSKRKRI